MRSCILLAEVMQCIFTINCQYDFQHFARSGAQSTALWELKFKGHLMDLARGEPFNILGEAGFGIAVNTILRLQPGHPLRSRACVTKIESILLNLKNVLVWLILFRCYTCDLFCARKTCTPFFMNALCNLEALCAHLGPRAAVGFGYAGLLHAYCRFGRHATNKYAEICSFVSAATCFC